MQTLRPSRSSQLEGRTARWGMQRHACVLAYDTYTRGCSIVLTLPARRRLGAGQVVPACDPHGPAPARRTKCSRLALDRARAHKHDYVKRFPHAPLARAAGEELLPWQPRGGPGEGGRTCWPKCCCTAATSSFFVAAADRPDCAQHSTKRGGGCRPGSVIQVHSPSGSGTVGFGGGGSIKCRRVVSLCRQRPAHQLVRALIPAQRVDVKPRKVYALRL